MTDTAVKTPLSDLVASALDAMRRGGAMSVMDIPDDSSYASHTFTGGVSKEIARRADLAAVPLQAKGAKPLDLSDDLRGQLWQIVLKMTACYDDGCGQNNCSCMARYARILAAIEPQPAPRELTVWYGKMPESNGRENWTAILRPKAGDHMDDPILMNGFCFARSEYPDRVRYEADRMRWIIGELTEKPHILAYDADLHSGYVEQPAPRDAQIAARDVIAERQRQISAEGWTPEHDDAHDQWEMLSAAACYAINVIEGGDPEGEGRAPFGWPWPIEWWKPTSPRRDLVKAGALIIAEIERLDRAAIAAVKGGDA